MPIILKTEAQLVFPLPAFPFSFLAPFSFLEDFIISRFFFISRFCATLYFTIFFTNVADSGFSAVKRIVDPAVLNDFSSSAKSLSKCLSTPIKEAWFLNTAQ